MPTHGTATLEADNVIRYEGRSRYYAGDTFVYRVCDDQVPALCSTARVTARSVIRATAETDPVPNIGDAADDPAIWVDPVDSSRSVVIGSDKEGGIAVYDLSGAELQYRPDGRMNNVDLRGNIVVASRRGTGLYPYRFDPATRTLVPNSARPLETAWSPYGLCLYQSAVSGKLYAFVTRRGPTPDGETDVEQWELFDNGAGQIDGAVVRTLRIGTQSEGCVADDELGHVYLGEEQRGIWRYSAEPDGGDARVLIDSTGPSGQLNEVEGLALAYGPNGSGYLIASSQSDDTFTIYRREHPNEHVRTFRVEALGEIDGAEESDGVDVTTSSLGDQFPGGVLVVQDGFNGSENQNFKFVQLGDVIGGDPVGPSCARPYAADSPWNTPVGQAPLYHAASDFHVAALQGTLTSDPDQFTFPVYRVDTGTPVESVPVSGWFSQVSSGGSTLTNQRAGSASLPIPAGALPADGADAQIVLLDPVTGDEWGASSLERDPVTGAWTAWNAYRYNTAWSAVPPRDASERPFFNRGAGVPYLAGLVRPCEIAQGHIGHALAFAYDSPKPSHVYPATKSDGKGIEPNDVPEGARFQLDPTLTDAEIRDWGCTGPCLTIAHALQQYGMYVIDNAGRAKVMVEYEGTANWNGVIHEDTVSAIPLSAFKLLEHGPEISD
jgi:3-phytase